MPHMHLAGSVLVALLLLPCPSFASVPELLAGSPASMGRAGAGAALGDQGASTWEQPAALGVATYDSLRAHVQGGRFWLGAVSGVERIDGRSGPIPQEAIAPWGFTMDAVKVLGPWLRAGAYASFPIPWLYFHETKDPWVPQAWRWQNRAARAVGTAGFSVRIPVRGVPGPDRSLEDVLRGGLWLGASLSILPRGNIEVDLDLVGLEETGTENARVDVALHDVDLAVRGRFRPQASLLFDFGAVHPRLQGLRVGAVWRGQTQVDLDPIHLGVHVVDLGNLYPLFNAVRRIDASVWLGLTDFYDPHQVQISLAWERERFAIAAEVTWGDWSSMIPAYGRVVNGMDGEPGNLTIQLGDEPEDIYDYGVIGNRTVDAGAIHDTVGFAVGGELRPPPVPVAGRALAIVVRLGYRFEPRVVGPTAGPMTLLDGDTHAVGLGFRLQGRAEGSIVRGPIGIELGAMGQRMVGGALGKDGVALAAIPGMPVHYETDAAWSGAWGVAASIGAWLSFGP